MGSVGAAGKYTSEEQRRELVERWRASGLTQTAFCRKEGLADWVFSTWKRKLFPTLRKTKTRTTVNPRSEWDWKQLIAEWKGSGLSDQEFCSKQQLKLNVFRKWCRFLAPQRNKQKKAQQLPGSTNPFVQVTVDSKPGEAAQLEILLPGGSKILVSEQTPLPLLAKVLSALEEKC